MPWKISERGGQYCVVKTDEDKVLHCYDNKEDALAYLRALYVHAADEIANEIMVETIRKTLSEKLAHDSRFVGMTPPNTPSLGPYVVDIVIPTGGSGADMEAIVVVGDNKYVKVKFTVADDGNVTLSPDEPVAVEEIREWRERKPPETANETQARPSMFYRYCMKTFAPNAGAADREAFCACLHERALGYRPAEAANDLVDPDVAVDRFVNELGGQHALTIIASAFLPAPHVNCSTCSNETTIELATVCNEAFHVSNEWIQLSPYGEFKHRLGVQYFQKPEAEQIVKAWENLGNIGVRVVGMPVYLGHPDHPDFERRYFDTRAYGRIKKLEARDDGLYAQVKWNKLGKEAIENEMFHGVSVNWQVVRGPDGKWHPQALKSVGLTNEPNIPVRPPTVSEP